MDSLRLPGEGTDPPLLSPAYLSEAETYYLRRLTSIRQRRPEHDVDCPFFREQAPPRIREKATTTPRTIHEPDGLFSAHRLAPEKLAQLLMTANPTIAPAASRSRASRACCGS